MEPTFLLMKVFSPPASPNLLPIRNWPCQIYGYELRHPVIGPPNLSSGIDIDIINTVLYQIIQKGYGPE